MLRGKIIMTGVLFIYLTFIGICSIILDFTMVKMKCDCPSVSQLTETQSESSYYSPQKVKSREVLCLEQEGITIEVSLHDLYLPCYHVFGEFLERLCRL